LLSQKDVEAFPPKRFLSNSLSVYSKSTTSLLAEVINRLIVNVISAKE